MPRTMEPGDAPSGNLLLPVLPLREICLFPEASLEAELGTLRLYHLQSIPTEHPDLRLTQFAPADDATRGALRHFV